MNSQGNTEQKDQFWQYHNKQLQNNKQLQTILQSHSNKSSTILAQKTDMKTSGTE
jgi:hypothetical protein